MKQTSFCRAISLVALLAIPLPSAAQEGRRQNSTQHHHYKLIDMGTLGGANSYVNFYSNPLNHSGVLVGESQTVLPLPPNANGVPCGSGPNVAHAFEWNKGVRTDLGALDPSSKNCSNVASVNDRGEIAGYSENGVLDPQTGMTELRAVLWRNGEITDLGTFGGNESGANGINNRGQIAGVALNTIPDPYSLVDLILGSTNGTQSRAFLWENGRMDDLGTLGGNDAWASGINQRGQVVGFSYTSTNINPPIGTFPCASPNGAPTVDPFLWDNGKMIDLGTLGGTCGAPFFLNNQGQVVGYSNLAGDQVTDIFFWDQGKLIDLSTPQPAGTFTYANWLDDSGEVVGGLITPPGVLGGAALWRNDVLTNLGALPGDCGSEAWTSNKGVVGGVSVSCDGNLWRAFLWEDGSMVDLNALVGPNPAQLIYAIGINDRGEIAGTGVLPGVSTAPPDQDTLSHAFLLIPCDENHPNVEGCDYSPAQANAAPASQQTVRNASWPLPPKLWQPKNRFPFPTISPMK
jgi:probable HAF family extracellular repeat protein